MFPLLKSGIRTHLTFAPDIGIACCILYNFLKWLRSQQDEEDDDNDDDFDDYVHDIEETEQEAIDGGNITVAQRRAQRVVGVDERNRITAAYCSNPRP
jgi:hypothetical protein